SGGAWFRQRSLALSAAGLRRPLVLSTFPANSYRWVPFCQSYSRQRQNARCCTRCLACYIDVLPFLLLVEQNDQKDTPSLRKENVRGGNGGVLQCCFGLHKRYGG